MVAEAWWSLEAESERSAGFPDVLRTGLEYRLCRRTMELGIPSPAADRRWSMPCTRRGVGLLAEGWT